MNCHSLRLCSVDYCTMVNPLGEDYREIRPVLNFTPLYTMIVLWWWIALNAPAYKLGFAPFIVRNKSLNAGFDAFEQRLFSYLSASLMSWIEATCEVNSDFICSTCGNGAIELDIAVVKWLWPFLNNAYVCLWTIQVEFNTLQPLL